MITKAHHFYMLEENPWPFLISAASFNMFVSFVVFLKFSSYALFITSLASSSLLTLYWWLSYSKEFSYEGKQSSQLNTGLKYSMLLFISSEVFFFFSFFWSYFHFFLCPSMDLGLEWPPVLVEAFDFSNVPMINTLVLLSSGVTVTVSHSMLEKSSMNKCLSYLALTVLLGMVFTFLQYMEYQSSFFSISDGTYGTVFFVLTGFHGLHVIIGTIYLVVSFMRLSSVNSTKEDCASFEMSSWYWHFVDVVWIFLFFFIYYINS